MKIQVYVSNPKHASSLYLKCLYIKKTKQLGVPIERLKKKKKRKKSKGNWPVNLTNNGNCGFTLISCSLVGDA